MLFRSETVSAIILQPKAAQVRGITDAQAGGRDVAGVIEDNSQSEEAYAE